MPARLIMYPGAMQELSAPGGMLYNAWVRLMSRVHARALELSSGVVVGVRTGNLRASHPPPTAVSAWPLLIGRQANTANYAAAVHNGSAPHEIQAVNARFLRFTPSAPVAAAGSGGGRYPTGGPVFRAVVHHPGTKPRPWLLMAAEEIAGQSRVL